MDETTMDESKTRQGDSSMTRIDHVAEAEYLIQQSRVHMVNHAPGEVLAALNLAEAQVHATLALVEQLRIANLQRAVR